MFTGLIETTGEIVRIERRASGARLMIRSSLPVAELAPGESIAVDGVCLTATSFMNDGFTVDVSPESLARTTLGRRHTGDRVNLERALRLSDRLGGHLVSGHVDGPATLKTTSRSGEFTRLDFAAPGSILKYIIEKGSVAIDGISLTVNSIDSAGFSVMIIPHTLSHTTLADRKAGEPVNIENDVIGKYVEKFVHGDAGAKSGVSRELLEKYNFL